MRIPFSKAYRAFHELDRFSDAECRRFVRAAVAQHRAGTFGVIVGAMVIGLVIAVASFTAASYTQMRLQNSGWGRSWNAASLIPPMLSLCGTLIGGVCALAWFDRWLRRKIRLRLKDAACGKCGYSLLGLHAHNGEIVCPECGDRMVLAAHGLTPDDLLQPHAPSSAQ
jgi:ribosomal protein S27AE